MAREIQAALKKGYSLKELSGLVKKEGVGISASVMKSTVGETEHKRQKKRVQKKARMRLHFQGRMTLQNSSKLFQIKYSSYALMCPLICTGFIK